MVLGDLFIRTVLTKMVLNYCTILCVCVVVVFFFLGGRVRPILNDCG